MFDKISAMRNSADSLESADSLGENQDSPSLEQLNNRVNQQNLQRKSHEKIIEQDHKIADIDLANELQLLEVSVSAKKEKSTINNDIEVNNELSIEDRIKSYTKSLKGEKSPQEILRLLISKFERDETVSVWVENWRNFQKLHQLAESKPSKERKAIQQIISKADFSNENAFNTSLSQIAQSKDISTETKVEISREFNGAEVFSVDDLDHTLKEVKSHRNEINTMIDTKSHKKEVLDTEIEQLEDKIDKLPLYSLERQELEEKLERKQKDLAETEIEINYLEKQPKSISFQLREGFSAKLNPDGSRSIYFNTENFSLKLPSHFLPFTTNKNLRTINLAFPYKILRNLHIADMIFSPLENNTVPSTSQRKMGHLILNSLGIDDTRILSEESIKQVKKDLSQLTEFSGKSPKECLIELGIYDIQSRSLNKSNFRGILNEIRENRS